jgi:DNA-binding MarR family transcriptional regulator
MIVMCNDNIVEKSRSLPKQQSSPPHLPSSSAAFLLAQLGSHAAGKFAERMTKLHLVPAHAGILRILGATPGLTQQALASLLGMVPSRLVALLDELDGLGLTERRRNEDDRRSHSLALTDKGRKTLAAIGDISREHQRVLLAALSDRERELLAELLQRIANEQGLTHNVHPGYRSLGATRRGGNPSGG